MSNSDQNCATEPTQSVEEPASASSSAALHVEGTPSLTSKQSYGDLGEYPPGSKHSHPHEHDNMTAASTDAESSPPRQQQDFMLKDDEDVPMGLDSIYQYSNSLTGRVLSMVRDHFVPAQYHTTHAGASLCGFWALMWVTCANYMLSPMRDAAALQVGVPHIPTLTLVSTLLAILSSVPIGWLFEAPDPSRRKLWKRMGLTRGDTQGTSLALFYRLFAWSLIGYALGFRIVRVLSSSEEQTAVDEDLITSRWGMLSLIREALAKIVQSDLGKLFYVAFFLVVHLMKLHSLSLVWGVTSEALEYEEQAEQRWFSHHHATTTTKTAATEKVTHGSNAGTATAVSSVTTSTTTITSTTKTTSRSRDRLKRLAFVGFGGTMGGILGSVIASTAAHVLHMSGLLMLSALFLELSAELSIELGRTMQRHWEEEQRRFIRQQLILQQRQQEQMLLMQRQKSIGPTIDEKENDQKFASSSIVVSNATTTTTTITCRGGGFYYYDDDEQDDFDEEDDEFDVDNSKAIVDTSLKKVTSAGFMNMKKVASGNSLYQHDVVLPPSSNLRAVQSMGNVRIGSQITIAPSHSHANPNPNPAASRNVMPASPNNVGDERPESLVDSSLKKVHSMGSMKRVASGNSLSRMSSGSSLAMVDTSLKKVGSVGSMKRVASGNSIKMRREESGASLSSARASTTSLALSSDQQGKQGAHGATGNNNFLQHYPQMEPDPPVDDNSFTQRLMRGITTILRSRLLMAIFTYNALFASTSVLLSFQRAELIANRSQTHDSNESNTESDTAFLARINMASSVAVFGLQASGLGAYIAHICGPHGTLSLMPLIRLIGVMLLCWWHYNSNGKPPDLALFLLLDELTRVMNMAVAKPVRESLWRGLSNEARYESKPIVDTLANRWGSGSAAFLVSLLGKIMGILSGKENESENTLWGLPPLLLLCLVVSLWWFVVSADVGHIRKRIDLELKKQSKNKDQ